MIKEYFICKFPEINEYVRSITGAFSDLNYVIFPIGILVEMFRNLIEPVRVESRVTILLLAIISMSIFTNYHQKALDLSFDFSDYILQKSKITSMDGFMSNNPNPSKSENASVNFNNMKDVFSYISNPVSTITNSIVLSGYWMAAAIGLTFCRLIYSCLYILFLSLSPLIIYLSIIPGMEGSMKAFWQTFVFFFISPIVFSVTLGVVKFVSVAIGSGDYLNIEALIQSIILIVMLLGSFVCSFYISSTTSIAKFASQASLMGAMTATIPLSAAGKGIVGAVSSPVESYNKMKGLYRSLNDYSSKGLNPMGNSVKDISKSPDYDVNNFTNKKDSLKPLNSMDSIGVKNVSPLRVQNDKFTTPNDMSSADKFVNPARTSSGKHLSEGASYSSYFSPGSTSNNSITGVSDIHSSKNMKSRIPQISPDNHLKRTDSPYNLYLNTDHSKDTKSSTGVTNIRPRNVESKNANIGQNFKTKNFIQNNSSDGFSKQ